MKIKFDTQLVKTMSLFEAVTRSRLKDAIEPEGNGTMLFIVHAGEIGRAVGKKGANVKILEKKLNRKIKIVEFNPQLVQFIENIVYPLKIENVSEDNGVVTITPKDYQTRGLLIGKNASNLRKTESVVKRYFQIEEIKVK